MPPGESPTTRAVAPRMVRHPHYGMSVLQVASLPKYGMRQLRHLLPTTYVWCDPICPLGWGGGVMGGPISFESVNDNIEKVPIERATLSCVWYCWPFILSFLQESFLDCETPTNGSIKMLSLATCPAIFFSFLADCDWWLKVAQSPMLMLYSVIWFVHPYFRCD